MPVRKNSVHSIDRKYHRLKRQSRWDRMREKMPFLILFGICVLAASIVLWILTQPKQQAPDSETLCIYVLDIGQGDAVLLQTQDHAVLVDGGDAEQGYRLLHMLKSLHVRSLDAVINSHPHADHVGGLTPVLDEIPVQALYFPDIPDALIPTTGSYIHVLETAQKHHIPVRIPQCHDTVSFGCAEIEFLCVGNEQFEDLNNCSLGCRITCGDVSMFLAGDLEKDGESAFLEAGFLQPATILKVSHHGSNSSSGEAFLSAVQPEFAAISCGALNDYGHPAQKCLERLVAAGCTVYRTDLDETILFTTDGSTIRPEPHISFGF
ncbi:MAG TPA: MBL fold metallo-hydrolase [Ruminococcus sp.]|nr:MBL fold metallo-hydrolase [Ruminococcus sp.]